MTKWDVVLESNAEALVDFVTGKLNCEKVQEQFRNKFPEASRELRSVIRNRGTQEARVLARKALRRRGVNV